MSEAKDYTDSRLLVIADSRYVFSQLGMAKALGIDEKSVRRFMRSDTLKTLLGEDFSVRQLKFDDTECSGNLKRTIAWMPRRAATAF